jgi:hypothetical protein
MTQALHDLEGVARQRILAKELRLLQHVEHIRHELLHAEPESV